MKAHKKRAGKATDRVQSRIRRAESLLEEVASRLGRIEFQFREETVRARELESKIFSQIAETRNQLGETGGGQTRPEGLIPLEEGCAVDLEEWEKKMDEKYAALCMKERQMRELEKGINGELEKLNSQIKQRDLLLSVREEELRTLKQSLASRLNELEIRIAQRSGERKQARLVSLFTDIGKRH